MKAFCFEYCDDDRMRVVIKSNQPFWFITCLVVSKVKKEGEIKSKAKKGKMVKRNMKKRY